MATMVYEYFIIFILITATIMLLLLLLFLLLLALHGYLCPKCSITRKMIGGLKS